LWNSYNDGGRTVVARATCLETCNSVVFSRALVEP
jgi:hypothetical protein